MFHKSCVLISDSIFSYMMKTVCIQVFKMPVQCDLQSKWGTKSKQDIVPGKALVLHKLEMCP